MAKEIGFGVVGLGMGVHHCKAITDAKGARLAAVCDTDPERLDATVKQYGVTGYADYAEMLRDDAVQCVCVVVESGKHADFGIQAAKAGKHLIMEKPVDITPAAIKRLRDVVRKTGVKAGCIFQYRYDPLNIQFKKAIDSGKMGKLIGAHAMLPWWRAQDYYQGPHGSWKGTWNLDGGGSLMNQGIHTVDLLQWLAGPVESVAGFTGVFGHDIEAEDQTVAILRFKNGALGTLTTTTCCNPSKEQRIFFYGSKGCFSRYANELEFFDVGTPKERERMMRAFGAREKKDSTSSDPMAVSADGHMLTVEDMVKCIRTGKDPYITIDSAAHAVEIANAIFKSAKTGKVVKVDSVKKW
jgi:UDP-N-acetyl-2-amino-2-deoxyglucuronate dehydrogenase